MSESDVTLVFDKENPSVLGVDDSLCIQCGECVRTCRDVATVARMYEIDKTKKGSTYMSISYNKLWKMLIDKNMTKTELTHLAGITTNAMAKLGKDEDVKVTVLEKLCTSLDCQLSDIVEFVPDKKKER